MDQSRSWETNRFSASQEMIIIIIIFISWAFKTLHKHKF
jgi:hypothetical protein